MLSVGDHDFDTPSETVEACVAAVRGGHHHYTQLPGIPALREAMAKVSTRATGVATTAAQVIATPGGQSALYAAVQGVLDPGDHAVVVAPYYATYPGTFRAAGADFTVVEAAAEDGFQPRAEAIEKALTPKTRAILLNTPNNPTGAVYSRAALEGIAELCRRHDLWLLSDEVYWTLGGGEHVSPRALDGMAERTLVINSLSKSHGMTGWRIGWLTGPAEFISAADQPQPGLHLWPQRFRQPRRDRMRWRTTMASKRSPRSMPGGARSSSTRSRGINNITVRGSEGGMYVMLDIRAIDPDCEKFAWGLLDAEKVTVMPGSSFGEAAAGHIRISLCQPDEVLKDAANRIRRFAASLREQGRVSNLPTKARAVIIGGGVSGCSVAYHLAKLGWTDIVLLERKQLTSGTTWHAAGLIGQLRGSQNMTRLAKYSADLYVKLEAETGVATGMRQVGSITRRADRGAQARDLPAGIAGARLRRRRARDLAGRSQGDVPASQHRRTWSAPCTCRSTASATRPTSPWRWPRAHASAARRSSKASRSPGSTRGMAASPASRGRKDGERRHDRGRHRRQLRRHVGARARRAERRQHPAARLRAFLSRSPSRSPGSTRLPVLRVPDECAYYKEDAGKMMLGAFEPVAKPWGMAGIPEDFCFDQLPEDFAHFEPILEMGVNRMPMLGTAGIHTFFNGPESFTPDDRYYLGEAPELARLFRRRRLQFDRHRLVRRRRHGAGAMDQ